MRFHFSHRQRVAMAVANAVAGTHLERGWGGLPPMLAMSDPKGSNTISFSYERGTVVRVTLNRHLSLVGVTKRAYLSPPGRRQEDEEKVEQVLSFDEVFALSKHEVWAWCEPCLFEGEGFAKEEVD